MGVDAMLIVRGPVTDEQFEAGVKFFADRYCNETPVRRSSGVVEIDLDGARYYGPGYERGKWPTIASAIIHARAAFPNHVIAYGGDADWDENLPEADDDLLGGCWTLWLSADWDAYYQRRAT